jgi:cell division protease FtsH
MKGIEKDAFSKIYFSNDLQTVYSESKEDSLTPATNEVKLVSKTEINPFVVDSISKLSTQKNVETYFLADPTQHQPPPSLLQTTASNLFNIGTNFLFIYFALAFIRVLFGLGSNRQGPGSNPMFPPFPGTLSSQVNKDKFSISKSNISLDSFAGSEEVMQECTEVVSYLKNATLYKQAGAEIPKGILLEGLPGTGKTLLAKAIASEAEANFISIAASEFVELFVGVGAAKIRDLFKQARQNKPCIVFIDEIDAVGKQRGSNSFNTNDEREQTLNQLLAEMDGFGDNEGVLVMAATNRKDILDSALLRPGRFDRLITVPLPDKSSRRKILDVYAKTKQLSGVNLDWVAELTSGFSGAQLKNLLNEAAIYAARLGNTQITTENVMSALDKLAVGIERKKDERDEETRRRIALHELGHAFLTYLCKDQIALNKVTIRSTYNGAGGYTLFNVNPKLEEAGLYTKDLLFKLLMISMGGKAAETVFYGENNVSVGAIQDLKQANQMAQKMIGNYGMGDQLEVFFNEDLNSGSSFASFYSENTKKVFDKESLALVNDAFSKAKKLIYENRDTIESLCQSLMTRVSLNGEEFAELMDKEKDKL